MQCDSTHKGSRCVLYIVHHGKHQDENRNTWFDEEQDHEHQWWPRTTGYICKVCRTRTE